VSYIFSSILYEKECCHKVSRGEVWITTHKHANVVFLSDEAREIGVSSILIKSIIVKHNLCYFN